MTMPASKRSRPGASSPKGSGKLVHDNAWPVGVAPIKQENKIGGEQVGGPDCVKNEKGTGSDMAIDGA